MEDVGHESGLDAAPTGGKQRPATLMGFTLCSDRAGRPSLNRQRYWSYQRASGEQGEIAARAPVLCCTDRGWTAIGDSREIAATATASGDALTLTGTKCFVLDAPQRYSHKVVSVMSSIGAARFGLDSGADQIPPGALIMTRVDR